MVDIASDNSGGSSSWNVDQQLPNPYGQDTSGSAGVSGKTDGGTAGGTGTTQKLQSFNTLLLDELEAADGSLETATNKGVYTSTASQPVLDPDAPDNTGKSSGAANPPITNSSWTSADLDQAYVSQLKQAVSSYTPALTQAQQSWVMMSLLDPNTQVNAQEVDPQMIKEEVSQVQTTAMQQMQQQPNFPTGWQPPKADGKAFASSVSAALQLAFQQTPGAASQKAALTVAFYDPQQATPAAVNLLNQLGIPALVSANISANSDVTIPAGWTPNSAAFNAQVTESYDLAFSSALDSYASSNNLTSEQEQQLTSAHYHPELVTDPQVKVLVQQLNGQALSAVGLSGAVAPGATLPVPNTALYDGSIQQNYAYLNSYNLKQMISSASPPLSADEQQLLQQLISDPNTPVPVGSKLPAMAAQIISQTNTTLQAKYGLPPSVWTTGALANAPALWAGSPVLMNGLITLQQSFQALQSHVQDIPPGPGQMVLMNYLKLIGQVLAKLQSTVFTMEAKQAESQSSLSTAQMEAALHQIQVKQDQIKKAAAQQADIDKAHDKSSKLNLAMTIVGAVVSALMICATIASFGTLGPVAVVVIVAFTTLSALDQAGIPATQNMMDGIGKMFGGALPPDQARMVVGIFMVAAALVTLNPAVVSQTFVGTGLTQNILSVAGADPKTTLIVTAVVSGVAMIAGGVGGAAASDEKIANDILDKTEKIATESARLAQVVADPATSTANRAVASAKIAYNKLSTQLLEFSLRARLEPEFLEKKIDVGSAMLDATNSGTEVAKGLNDATIDRMQAAMANAQAKADAQSTLLDGDIETLKQEIKMIQSLLQSLTDWTASISQFQQQKYTDAQKILSNTF